MTTESATVTETLQGNEAGLPERFNLLAQLLHWTMASAILAMLFIGVAMMTSLTWRPRLLDLHQPLGIAILLLAIVRFTRWMWQRTGGRAHGIARRVALRFTAHADASVCPLRSE